MRLSDRVALEVLYDRESGAPETDAERSYGAPLRFPDARPHVVANFVATVDGVVSLGLTDGTDSSKLSGKSPADRWVMALLRAAADVVLIGAGTLRASAGHQWTAARLAPSDGEELGAYRSASGCKTPDAPLVVVTGKGELPQHVALTRPATDVVIVTTESGSRRVAAEFPRWRRIVLPGDDRIDGALIVRAMHTELGARLVLCEGGPTLLGTLLVSGSAHELFLTIAPRVAGRDASHPRPGMVQGWAAGTEALRDCELRSARRAGEHLLLRYGVQPPASARA